MMWCPSRHLGQQCFHNWLSWHPIHWWPEKGLGSWAHQVQSLVTVPTPLHMVGIIESFDQSTARCNAQDFRYLAITSGESCEQAFNIHWTIAFFCAGHMFSASIYSSTPLATHSLYCSVTNALNGLFQLTSGACTYFAQPAAVKCHSINALRDWSAKENCLENKSIWPDRGSMEVPTSVAS